VIFTGRFCRTVLLLFVTLASFLYLSRAVDFDTFGLTIKSVDPVKGGIAMTALLIGFALSCWRLKLVAGDLGYRISAGDAAAAASLGQLGGALFFPPLPMKRS
jgi:hypothetical protein